MIGDYPPPSSPAPAGDALFPGWQDSYATRRPPPLAGGSLCPVHTGTAEPCPTCSAYIAAGL